MCVRNFLHKRSAEKGKKASLCFESQERIPKDALCIRAAGCSQSMMDELGDFGERG